MKIEAAALMPSSAPELEAIATHGKSTEMAENSPAVVELPVVVGRDYDFYSEMQQSTVETASRMRNYTGQKVTVIAGPMDQDDPDDSLFYEVKAADGRIFTAAEEELNGWDKALGQYFWPDGTYGPDRRRDYLSNDRNAVSSN